METFWDLAWFPSLGLSESWARRTDFGLAGPADLTGKGEKQAGRKVTESSQGAL